MVVLLFPGLFVTILNANVFFPGDKKTVAVKAAMNRLGIEETTEDKKPQTASRVHVLWCTRKKLMFQYLLDYIFRVSQKTR